MGADSWHCSAVCRYVSRLGRVQPWVDCTALKTVWDWSLSHSLSLCDSAPGNKELFLKLRLPPVTHQLARGGRLNAERREPSAENSLRN